MKISHLPSAPLVHFAPLPSRFTTRSRNALRSGLLRYWVANAALLRRPGDWPISRAVRRSMYKLVAASIEMAGHRTFGGLPLVFSI